MQAQAAGATDVYNTGLSLWHAYAATIDRSLNSATSLLSDFLTVAKENHTQSATAAIQGERTAPQSPELSSGGTKTSIQNSSRTSATSLATPALIVGAFATKADLRTAVGQLAYALTSALAASLSASLLTVTGGYSDTAPTRINNLSFNNLTVNGVAGLTDADIPDSITASNYLPLAGGTLAGNLTLSGSLTVAGAQTLSGAITVPYLAATSTAATSTFAGGLSITGLTDLATTTITGALTVAGIPTSPKAGSSR